jgi:hypothetical protein
MWLFRQWLGIKRPFRYYVCFQFYELKNQFVCSFFEFYFVKYCWSGLSSCKSSDRSKFVIISDINELGTIRSYFFFQTLTKYPQILWKNKASLVKKHNALKKTKLILQTNIIYCNSKESAQNLNLVTEMGIIFSGNHWIQWLSLHRA